VRGFVITFSALNTVDCHLSVFIGVDKGRNMSCPPPTLSPPFFSRAFQPSSCMPAVNHCRRSAVILSVCTK
jgi:hypothetical protein